MLIVVVRLCECCGGRGGVGGRVSGGKVVSVMSRGWGGGRWRKW